ncbi:MAG: hypothetical protein Q4F50_05635 [Bacteroides sp.]|nr:hypothetical protein [Bacteroides sp.]MDO5419527.1 hypothetical protein [Bacteroides sp.]
MSEIGIVPFLASAGIEAGEHFVQTHTDPPALAYANLTSGNDAPYSISVDNVPAYPGGADDIADNDVIGNAITSLK